MKPFRIVAPIVVLVGALGIGKTLIATKPEAQRRAPPPSILTVDARFLSATNYPVKVPSQGVVRARTRSSLIAQVPGEIVKVAPAFRDGGFFEEGELLAQIDPRDFETAVTVAEAALKQAEAAYAVEVAQAAQARADWERLGLSDDPSPLTLREPQLAEAEASVASARARVEEARRNLERTSIMAPYAGRLLSQQVDVGQFVGAGATLATIYAVDLAEIRLPLSDAEYGFVGMPERYRQDQRENVGFVGPTVTLSGVVGRETEQWPGRLVRTEGAIDSSSRQHFVIAQVDDPYGISDANRLPLKVGLFVEAVIDGVTLPEVFVVPRSAIRNGNEALVIDAENRLQSRSVEVIWGTESEVVIESGLQEGELLCLTPLPFAANGAPVAPDIEGQGLRRLGGGDGGMRPNQRGGPGGAGRPGGGAGAGGPGRGGPGPNGGRPEGPRGAGAARPSN